MADHWQSDRPTSYGSDQVKKTTAWCLGCFGLFFRRRGSDESCAACPPSTAYTTSAQTLQLKRAQASA